MTDLNFEWDPIKAESNQKKHGVDFVSAKSVFLDDYARLISDPDSSVNEERFIILGKCDDSKVLVVCHCYRDADNLIRIISARKADKRERKQYEGFKYA
ncbi:BrnT family toxin [Psychrosphaera haliotis]|uniref:BrnT family toxin n=1 Tax=Psychrosphaera haliotis TaxID=555083 RepID=UPI0031D8C415